MEFVIDNQVDLKIVVPHILEAMTSQSVVLFKGEMGAGKTTLIKEICKSLGVKDAVNSPTFSIVNEYRNEFGKRIYHFDFYRLKTPREAFDIGFEEYIDSGALCLIEWPEKLGELIPKEFLEIRIEQFPNNPLKRIIKIQNSTL